MSMCDEPYEKDELGDLPAEEDIDQDIEIFQMDPNHIKEEDGILNPYCELGSKNTNCKLNFPQCLKYNSKSNRCAHFRTSLDEEQNYLRLMEIERLDQIRYNYEHKVKRLKYLNHLLENRNDVLSIVGCGGCLLWIALMIAVLAGGVYAIKWACFLFKCAWNMQL